MPSLQTGAALPTALAIPLASPRPVARRITLRHFVLPNAIYSLVMGALVLGDLDRRIAGSWAYIAGSGWIGQDRWWANDLIHAGGHALVCLIGLCALAAWIASFLSAKWRPRRRASLYAVLGLALTTGLVGLIKIESNTDCPWSLEGFGGNRPYVSVFESRPDALPAAGCFPGAHSSSGFALLGFYFLLRDRRPRAAKRALAAALLIGTVFAFGQEARGAHFLSHDLTSAMIAWDVLLGLYLSMLAERSLGWSTPIVTYLPLRVEN